MALRSKLLVVWVRYPYTNAHSRIDRSIVTGTITLSGYCSEVLIGKSYAYCEVHNSAGAIVRLLR